MSGDKSISSRKIFSEFDRINSSPQIIAMNKLLGAIKFKLQSKLARGPNTS
eukprot:IDg12464t1